MLRDSQGLNSNSSRHTERQVQSLLAKVQKAFATKPFKPHPLFTTGHAQTLAAYAWPRRALLRSRQLDEERLFEVEPGAQVLAQCRWQANRTEHPTLVLWHGIEGSSVSVYMLGTAEKGFRAGFNVVRLNLRNCGGTEHLTPTLYHGGLTEDLRVVVAELIHRDRLPALFLVGYSLGGNMVLKLAGEYGEDAPEEVLAVAAVSPSVDLHASADLISERRNWIYHRNFVMRLHRRISFKSKLYPDLYDAGELSFAQTLREFDDRFTAPAFGFAGVDDYYTRASALPVMARIRIPTLIIHAQDDPFIPFAPLNHPSIAANPYILLLAPEQGGHVAFVAAKSPADADLNRNTDSAAGSSADLAANARSLDDGTQIPDVVREDRFWAENRVVEFCRLTNKEL